MTITPQPPPRPPIPHPPPKPPVPPPHPPRPVPVVARSLARLTLTLAAAPQSGPDIAQAWRRAHEAEIVRDFAELLTYPNRASDTEDITRAALYIRDRLREAGGEPLPMPEPGEPVDPEWRI